MHVYLKSLYIALTALGLNLKIVPIRYKKLNNPLYLRAGMPSEALERRLSQLTKTNYGYELKGNWDLSGYNDWYQAQLLLGEKQLQEKQGQQKIASQPIATETTVIAPPTASQTVDQSIDTLTPNNNHMQLTLTPQQYAFLKDWQWDKYPATIDSGFVFGLQQVLLAR